MMHFSPWSRPTWLALCLSGIVPAQVAWTDVSPPADPGPRSDVAMTYDSDRGVVVLSGGWDGTVDLTDTWEWDGTSWTQASPAVAPGRHSSHKLAYDSRRQRVVRFGGYNGGALLGDTWEYDGTTWEQRFPANSPSRRYSYGMCYDPSRGVTVLHGGLSPSGGVGDTWEWDGVDWVQATPANSPGVRYSFDLVFDENLQRVLLFGGSSGNRRADTWVWDGTDWTQLTPATRPTARSTHSAAFDSLRGRVVVFGGFGGGVGNYLNDVWEFDGTTWQQRQPGASPSIRGFGTMTFDAARGDVLLYGGAGVGGIEFADSWAYQTTARPDAVPSGAGCIGSAGPLALSAAGFAWSGESVRLDLGPVAPGVNVATIAIGASDVVWAGNALPVALDGFGAPGCSVWTALEFPLPAAVIGATATTTVAIPPDVTLVGLPFYAQGLVPDAVNPLGLVFSNGLGLTIGAK